MLSTINRTIPASLNRAFSTTAIARFTVTRPALAATKKVSADAKAKQKVRAQIKKEQANLAKLQKKFKEASKKLAKDQKEREKKAERDALKPIRRINLYAYFVMTQKGHSLLESRDKWHKLSDSEKAQIETKTKEYNDKRAQLLPPKPKKPTQGFALYVQENYKNNGEPVKDAIKAISEQWKKLSLQQKEIYNVLQEELTQYKKDLEAWRKTRLENFAKQ